MSTENLDKGIFPNNNNLSFDAEEKVQHYKEQIKQVTDTLHQLQHTPLEVDCEGFTSAHILIVDDNYLNRDILARRLTREGFEIDMAIHGAEALKKIKKVNYNIVLLDLIMPVMDGYQVLEQLQREGMLQNLSVIIISAVDEIKSVVRCIEMGAEDYLSKPFNPTVLKARIGAILEKQRLQNQQRAYVSRLNLENERKSLELEQARLIQQAMLPPQAPQHHYLDISANQQTATEVGGDYYDFLLAPNGNLRIVIGDATGHGAASGLMVAATKASLLATDEPDLKHLINKINQILAEVKLANTINMALTVIQFEQLSNEQVQVTAIGGGMPPLFVKRNPTNQFAEYLIAGLPLGVWETALYSPMTFTLNRGDFLILMSDGLPEMFNSHHKILEFDRLISTLVQLDVNLPNSKTMLHQVEAIGHDWANSEPLHDDVTVIVVKVK